MIKITSLQAIAGALLACCLSAAPATALANRTWVSGHGTDSGTCSPVAAPCRTFAFALTQTNASGEIDVLDPAGYGTVTINKAIRIINDGVGTAGILASSGNAITINAGNGGVHLRGLTIKGVGTGLVGILFNTGENLVIDNCVIQGFNQTAIKIAPTNPGFSGTVLLSKVISQDNGVGIAVDGSAVAIGPVNVTVVDSVVSNGTLIGINAISGQSQVMVRNSVVNNSDTGIFAMNAAIIRVGHSVVTGNEHGVATVSGGTIFSYGDNDIDGNKSNNTGALTPLAMH